MRTTIMSVCILALAGCSTTKEPRMPEDPFEIVFVKKAQWTEGQEGYDANLPGYHITGDICIITLEPRAGRLPKKLTLAIRTTPTMKPNLEGFFVLGEDSALESSALTDLTHVRNPKGSTPFEPVAAMKTSKCFKYEIKDHEIHVTFLPPAMKLLRGKCEISWIDWYR